jgi:hypothetical protein
MEYSQLIINGNTMFRFMHRVNLLYTVIALLPGGNPVMFLFDNNKVGRTSHDSK